MDTPKYYALPGGGELWDIFTPEEQKVICKFNTIKYAYRAGNKDGEDEAKDLRKARRYIDTRLKAIEAAAKNRGQAVKNKGQAVKRFALVVRYTDGSEENITLNAVDAFAAECMAARCADQHRSIKEISQAREVDTGA